MKHREPSVARKCAQLKQQIRLAKCIHPENALNIVYLIDGGYVEYCVLCDKIVDMYEP